MGLFDDVVTELYCPFCGTRQAGFQTKDFDSQLDRLTLAEVEARGGAEIIHGLRLVSTVDQPQREGPVLGVPAMRRGAGRGLRPRSPRALR